MFLGRYRHTLDSKGRLTIPSRYRELLAGGAYVIQGLDRNLWVLTPETFEGIARKVNEKSITDPSVRLLRRLIYSNGEQVEVDKAGRILIPQFLREAIGLQDEALLVGVGDYFEIWSPVYWLEQEEQLRDVEANAQRFVEFDISAG
jgi:MraZ protein